MTKNYRIELNFFDSLTKFTSDLNDLYFIEFWFLQLRCNDSNKEQIVAFCDYSGSTVFEKYKLPNISL